MSNYFDHLLTVVFKVNVNLGWPVAAVTLFFYLF